MNDKKTYCRDMAKAEAINVIKEIIEGAYSFHAIELVKSFLDNERSVERIHAILYDK